MSVERVLARAGFAAAAVLAGLGAASAQGIGGTGIAAQASLRGGVSLFLVFAVVLLLASASLLAVAVFGRAEPSPSTGRLDRLDRERATPTWE